MLSIPDTFVAVMVIFSVFGFAIFIWVCIKSLHVQMAYVFMYFLSCRVEFPYRKMDGKGR